MSKSGSVLILSACMALQLVTAFPQSELENINSISATVAVQPNATNSTNTTQTTTTTAENDVMCTEPYDLIYGTLMLMTKQSEIILIESRNFLKDLLGEMKALPAKSAGIEQNITRVEEVLKQINAINFDADPPHTDEMFATVDEVGKLYDEFYGMPANNDTKSDVAILEKLFDKVGSQSLEERLNVSLNATFNGFKTVFEKFKNL